MLRLLASPRWLGYLALAVAFAIACCALGVWQWNRRAEAQAAIARLDANWGAEAVPLDTALPDQDSYDESQQWLPVTAQGRYLADEQLLLRGRLREGLPGFQVIVPFETTTGRILMIDRGWVAAADGNDVPEDAVPAPPTGELEVVARLRADEGALAGRGAPDGQIASVDLEALNAQLGGTVATGAYGLLRDEDGRPATGLAPQHRPVLDEGPHLSYSLQWYVFAVIGFIGFGWALRQEARAVSGDERPQRRRVDDEEEDAILDAG